MVKNESDVERSVIKIEPSSYEERTNSETMEHFDKLTNHYEDDYDFAEDIEDIETLSESQDDSKSTASDTEDLKVCFISIICCL